MACKMNKEVFHVGPKCITRINERTGMKKKVYISVHIIGNTHGETEQ